MAGIGWSILYMKINANYEKNQMSPHTIPDLDKNKFSIIFDCQNCSGGLPLKAGNYLPYPPFQHS